MSKWVLLGEDDLVGDWVAKRTGGTYLPGSGPSFALCEGTRIIAGVSYDNYNGACMQMHVAAEPGARWLTREFLRICFAYPFKQCRVNKVIGLVGSGNEPARRFDEHLGFVLEATLKGAHPDGDLLVYSMDRAQCRWLNLRGTSNGQKLCSAGSERS